MSKRREFHAHTLDEALDRAAVALGQSRSKLSYEVVDAGSAGFLGLGARDVRITVETEEPECPDEGAAVLDGDELDPIDKNRPTPSDNGELGREAVQLIESILERMNLSASVEASGTSDHVLVNISSEDAGLLIGQKGETLHSLQHFVNVVLSKESGTPRRVLLDADGYRGRREEALKGMAHRAARKAVRSGQPVTLPPMNSWERRVIHVFLKKDPEVSSQSTGNYDNRRVVVSPYQNR